MTSAPPDSELQYTALTTRAGLTALANRTQIELTGADRASFLHNMCTNDIKRLGAGEGCEAFFCNAQGKTVGHGYIFAAPDSHVVDAGAGQGSLLAHLDRYIIREKVELRDRTDDWHTLYLGGVSAGDVLKNSGVANAPSGRLSHIPATIGGTSVWVRRVDWTLPTGFAIVTATADEPRVREALLAAGATLVDVSTFETARIEAGTPVFGRDIAADNLPQELARDPLAISFNKGCYLGQETVARIDALGHVNRTLVGVRIATGTPQPGDELFTAEKPTDKPVGRVTSACHSPRLNAGIALAYVRRGHETAGTKLVWNGAPADVIALPIT